LLCIKVAKYKQGQPEGFFFDKNIFSRRTIVFGLEVLSLTKSRPRHLAMVLVLTPKRRAKSILLVLAQQTKKKVKLLH
jgi:hypothetical protein